MALAACSGGAGSAGAPPTGGGAAGQGGDGTLAAGDVVARVELEMPKAREFVLRATLPVPRGFYDGSGPVPLAVATSDRSPVPTQVEVVSRYPAPADGADVVEVLARVSRPAGVKVGDRHSFFVATHAREAEALEISPAVRDFLASPGTLVLRTKDVFGNVYTADLYRDARTESADLRVLRDGELARQVRTHEVLLPEQPGAQGTYPHLMGVHAYVTQWEGASFFSLDLHVHNGMAGRDAGDPTDDALAKLYFENLELRLPRGWSVAQALPSPYLGEAYGEDAWNVVPLVKPLPGGKLHLMPQQSQFVRRLVVFKGGDATEALDTLQERSLAFAQPGRAPAGGRYWSWWNGETARYFPQNHRIPTLDHVGLASIRQSLANKHANYQGHLEAGSSTGGGYPLLNEVLGWAHPWGVKYGGMTGGTEIYLYDGLEVAATASREGYRLYQMFQRMYADRNPIALYDKDGDPTSVEDWLVSPAGGEPYVPFDFFLRPDLPDHDPFGFGDAPSGHASAVASLSKQPYYEGELLGYKAIDFQHYVRQTRNDKVLAWLGNDALSKDGLRLSAEMFRLSYHQYPNAPNGNSQGSGLRAGIEYVAEYPGWGIGFGRGNSWGLDAALAAYAFGDEELRGSYYPWFGAIAQMVAGGQSTCTGIIQSQPQNKKADGQYRLVQAFEEAINQNALWGLRTSVFEGRDAARSTQLATVVERSTLALVSDLMWRTEHDGPVSWLALGPYDKTLPPFCDLPPEDGNPNGADHYQSWSAFGYGFRLSGNQDFLERAHEMIGGYDLYQELQQDGCDNLENRAALLALVQELHGDA